MKSLLSTAVLCAALVMSGVGVSTASAAPASKTVAQEKSAGTATDFSAQRRRGYGYGPRYGYRGYGPRYYARPYGYGYRPYGGYYGGPYAYGPGPGIGFGFGFGGPRFGFY